MSVISVPFNTVFVILVHVLN